MRGLFLSWVFWCLVGGCGPRTFLGTTPTGREPNRMERNALQRGNADLQCPPASLMVVEVGGAGYRVEGCGQFITYTCMQQTPGSRRVMCVPGTQGYLAGYGPPAPAPVQTVAAMPPPQPPAAPAPPPPSGPEVDAARALVATRAPSILACTAADAVAVDMTWDAQGRLAVALIGPNAGTPAEDCVRASLAGATVSPAGAGGHVIAAVQR